MSSASCVANLARFVTVLHTVRRTFSRSAPSHTGRERIGVIQTACQVLVLFAALFFVSGVLQAANLYVYPPGGTSCAPGGGSWSGNLLVNGNAENGITGWTVDTPTFLTADYSTAWAGNNISTSGSKFFYGTQAANVVAHQDVSLSGMSGSSFQLSALLGGYGDGDTVELKVIFKESDGDTLQTFTTGPVTSNKVMSPYSISGTVPSRSTTATVQLSMVRHSGTDADGYSDDIVFRVGTAGSVTSYTSIQSAVNAAASGDTITICGGTYNGQVNLSGKSLALQSSTGNAADVTVTATSSPVINTNSPTTINNLTIASGTSGVIGVNICPSNPATLAMTGVAISTNNNYGIFQDTAGHGCQGLALNLANSTVTSTSSYGGIRVNNGVGTHLLNYMNISAITPIYILGGAGATLTDVDVTGTGDNTYGYLVDLENMSGDVTFTTAQKSQTNVVTSNSSYRGGGILVSAQWGNTIGYNLANVNVNVYGWNYSSHSITNRSGGGYGNYTLNFTNVSTGPNGTSGIYIGNGAGNHVINNATLYGWNGYGYALSINGGTDITLTDVDAIQLGTSASSYPAVNLNTFTGNLTINAVTKTGSRCADINGNANTYPGACITNLDTATGTTSTNSTSYALSICNASTATSQVNISNVYAQGGGKGISLYGGSGCGKYTANFNNVTAAVTSAYFSLSGSTSNLSSGHGWAYPITINNGTGTHTLTKVTAVGTYAYNGLAISGGGATLTDVQATGLSSAVSISATGAVTISNPTWAAANPYPATNPANFPIRGVSWNSINGMGLAVSLATTSPTAINLQNTAIGGANTGLGVNYNGYSYPYAKLVMSNVTVDGATGDGVMLYYGTGQAHSLSNVTVTAARTAMQLSRGTGATLSNINLTCGDDGATAGTGLYLDSQTSLTLSGINTITCKSPSSKGIYAYNTSTTTLGGATIDMSSQSGSYGIYTDHNGPGSTWTISGNYIKNAPRHGLDMYGYPSTVTNNIIENSGTESGYYGLAMERGQGIAYNNCVYSPTGHVITSQTSLCAGNGQCNNNYPLIAPLPSTSATRQGNFWGSWPKGTGFSDTCADANGDGVCDPTTGGDYAPLAKCNVTIAGSVNAPVAEYRMDESGWSGATGELKDTAGYSGGPYNGQAVGSPLPVPYVQGKVCGAASLPGPSSNGGAFLVSNLPVDSTGAGAQTTVAFWMYWDGTPGPMPVAFSWYDLYFSGYQLGFNTFSGGDNLGANASGLIGAWHHVTAIFTNGSVSKNELYFDGVKQTLTQNGTPNSNPTVDSNLAIGGYPRGSYYRPTMYVDEVKVWKGALTAAQIQAGYANENAGKNWDGSTRTCAQVVTGPSALNAVNTGAAAVSGKISTKSAGSAFNLDVYALNAAKTSQDSTFNGSVLVDLLANANLGTGVDSQNCPTSSSALSVGTVTLASGKGSIAVPAIANSWRDVRVRLRYPATGSATLTTCSSDNFAVKPASLAVQASDTDWATAGIGRVLSAAGAGSTPTHKAGRPFTLTVTGYNASSVATSNYTGNPVATSLTALDIGASAGTLSVGSFSGSGGTITSTTASYGDVGSVSAQFQDTGYASVDAGDSSADCTGYYVCSGTITLGRFVPDHFTLSSGNASPACGTFNHFGQDGVGTTFSLVAQDASGNTTGNYAGGLARLDLSSYAAFNFSAGGLPSGVTFGSGATPPSGTWASGVAATVAASHLATRPATAIAPASIAFFAQPTDQDGVSTASAIALGSAIPFRYGRVRIQNAYGSQLLDLAMSMKSEYWNGTGWITNPDDGCTTTTLAIATAGSSNITGQTCVRDSLGASGAGCSGSTTASRQFKESGVPGFAGDFNLWLKAPGVPGSVDVTATVPSWLQYNWTGTTGNPKGRATFGVFKSGPAIYMRENF